MLNLNRCFPVQLRRMRPGQLEALDQTARMEVVTIGSCGAGYRDPEGRAIGLRSELVATARRKETEVALEHQACTRETAPDAHVPKHESLEP